MTDPNSVFVRPGDVEPERRSDSPLDPTNLPDLTYPL